MRITPSGSRLVRGLGLGVLAAWWLGGCAVDHAGLTGGALGFDGGAAATGGAGEVVIPGTGGAGDPGDPVGTGGAGVIIDGSGGAGPSAECLGGCDPCFRCGAQGCEPNPTATWSIVCQSAIISPVKPGGMTWDAIGMSPQGAAPDATCQVTFGDRSRSSQVVPDSLTPVWNQTVSTLGGQAITTSLLLAADGRWTVAVIDQDGGSGSGSMNGEYVCTVTPRLGAEDLARGAVTFTDIGSCTQLNLVLVCSSP